MEKTLYLSRLNLNPHSPEAMRDYANPYAMHVRLEGIVPAGRLLYRVEKRPRPWVLIQSDAPPDFSRLPSGYGEGEVRTYRLAPRPGRLHRFRLRANVAQKREEGKVLAILPLEERVAWLEERLSPGARLVSLRLLLDEGWIRFQGRTGKISLVSTLFEGFLEVGDPQGLIDLVHGGIGRAKAFGFGLLSLLPA